MSSSSSPAVGDLLKLVTQRRSNYTLSQESTISDSEIRSILETTLEQAPSTFGSYTTRLVLLVKEEHLKFWDIVTEVVKGVTPPDAFEGRTKARLDGFRNAYGTILFLEDPENTRKLQDDYPFAKDHFPVWSHHTSAIHQYIIWTALTAAGNGANLQHYNPLIDERVKQQWNIPANWNLVAQLVFGKPTGEPGPKPVHMKKPMEERLQIYGTTPRQDVKEKGSS